MQKILHICNLSVLLYTLLMTNITQKEYTVESQNILHLTFDNFDEMVEHAKNLSCYCQYRFGTQAFGGHYDICQHKNFQIANAIFHDGLMFKGYPPKGTLSFIVIIDKQGSLSANKQILNKGEILILDDNDEYEIAFSHHMQEGIISIKKEFVDAYFPYLNHMINKIYYDTNGILKNLIKHLENKKDCTDDDMQSWLIESLEALSLHKQKEITKKLSKKEALIFDIRDYIIEYSKKNIHIGDLALKFGMSEKTMQTGFKKLFGYTPKKFMKLLKMNLAREDIIENDGSKTISEIAMKYGFGNFGLFSKEYKQIYGLLPSKTRGLQLCD